MPHGQVKSKHDEKLWKRAKLAYRRAVARGNKVGDKWRYISGTYQNMKGK